MREKEDYKYFISRLMKENFLWRFNQKNSMGKQKNHQKPQVDAVTQN